MDGGWAGALLCGGGESATEERPSSSSVGIAPTRLPLEPLHHRLSQSPHPQLNLRFALALAAHEGQTVSGKVSKSVSSTANYIGGETLKPRSNKQVEKMEGLPAAGVSFVDTR